MKAPGIPVPSNAFPAEHSIAVNTGGVHSASTIFKLQSVSEMVSEGAVALALMESLEFNTIPVISHVPPVEFAVPRRAPFE